MAQSASKIAVVVQRYGAAIIGGAEAHARLVAEQLQRQAGYQVEVYTTTSRDYLAWDDTLPAGTQIEGDVVVHRFRPQRRRGLSFKILNGLLKLGWQRAPAGLRAHLERWWIESQGPFVPDLVETLAERQEQYAAVIFFTYLYYPTLMGLPRISRPKILVPTAHDERAFYMQHVRRLFAAADLVFANTPAEVDLIARVHRVSPSKFKIVGVGVEPPQVVRVPELAAERPVRLLYMGRVGPAKGVDELMAHFKGSQQGGAVPCELRIAGPLEGEFRVPTDDPRITYLGVLSEAAKAEELRLADVVVNPSRHESLSLLVLEAVAAQKIVLVQSTCAVLAAYAAEYPTVLGYEGAQDFQSQLQVACTMMQSPAGLSQALRNAAAAVDQRYSWGHVVQAYREAIPIMFHEESSDDRA